MSKTELVEKRMLEMKDSDNIISKVGLRDT